MLLRVGRVFFSLCMVAFAMLFGRGAMRLRSILMMFCRLVVLVSGHWNPPVIVYVGPWKPRGGAIGSNRKGKRRTIRTLFVECVNFLVSFFCLTGNLD